MYTNVLFSLDEKGVATITLNRPEVLNSLDSLTCKELTDAFISSNNNSAVKLILFTAEGKGFCSGQDLKFLSENKNIVPSEVIQSDYVPLILAMRDSSKIIICKLHGTAVGAGCSLVFASDVVIASKNAVLSQAFIGIGLVPDSGSVYFLSRLVGRMKAFELMTLGNKLTSTEAASLGLVNKVVEHEILENEVKIVIDQYLHSPLIATGLIKKMLNDSYHLDLKQVLKLEGSMQDIAASSEDFKEGLLAFQQKRKPVFQGK